MRVFSGLCSLEACFYLLSCEELVLKSDFNMVNWKSLIYKVERSITV